MLAPLLLAAAQPAFEDLARLDARIAAVADAQPLDPRLRLPACGTAVDIDPPVAGALAVRCASPAWRIRVPVRMTPAAAAVVRRNDPVEVRITGAAFAVTTGGTALSDAGAGAPVRVRSDNGRLLTGLATGPGLVVVGR